MNPITLIFKVFGRKYNLKEYNSMNQISHDILKNYLVTTL